MKKNKNLLLNACVVIVIVLMYFISVKMMSPPKAVLKSAPSDQFSAQRAMEHIENMCRKPHKMGTDEHRNVRNYIVDQCNAIGLKTEIQETTVFGGNQFTVGGKVYNIIAILKGKKTSLHKSVLIAAHYDSEPNTPGAADDGSGVAAMLETARALKHLPQLNNDVVFLFTDGEEAGLLGANAFANKHPLKDQIGIVFNLEARGNTGTSVVFEVSPGNGHIMKEFAQCMPYPFAASIMYEFYRKMPNNTDFTIFKRAGWPGFNAAYIDNYVTYHSMTDSIQNLDQNSLQHHGSYIINFAKHFGNADLENLNDNDAIFFNPVGNWLILFPASLNIPLIILAFLLFVVYIVIGVKKKRLTIKGAGGGFLTTLLGFVLALGFVWLLQKIILAVYPQYSIFYSGNFYNIHYYFVAFGALAVAVFTGLHHLLFIKLKWENLYAGFLAVVICVMFILFVYIPTAAYVAFFPLFFILIGGIVCFVLDYSEEKKPVLFLLIQTIAVLPAIGLFAPEVKLLLVAFGLNLVFIGMLVFLILLGFLIPQIKTGKNLHAWLIPGLSIILMIAVLIGGHFNSDYNETRPMQSNVMYCFDKDNGNAMWVSRNVETDEWNRQFFPNPKRGALAEMFPYARRIRIKNEAPKVEIPESSLNVISDEVVDGRRKLSFHVQSGMKADVVYFMLKADSGVIRMVIDGEEAFNWPKGKVLIVDAMKGYQVVEYNAFPTETVEVTLECAEGQEVEVVLVEKKMGLPELPQYKVRPRYIIPDKGSDSDVTMVKKTFKFGSEPLETKNDEGA